MLDSSPLRVACVQYCAGTSVARNLEIIGDCLARASEKGAELVQLPEMANLMQIDKNLAAEELRNFSSEVFLEALQELAITYKLWIHVGSLIVPKRHGFRNRGFVIGDGGELKAKYDKIHLFDVDLANGESYRESAVFHAGETAIVVETPWGKLGLAICFDLRFGALYRTLSEAGATILTAPAAFTKTTGQAHWHTLVRARAIENGAIMIACNQGGKHEDGRETYGHSLIVDAWGDILAEGGDEGTQVVVADLDPASVARARKMIATAKLERNFSVKLCP